MIYRILGTTEKKARTILFAGLILFALLHLYGLSYPPNGYHQWRESDTSAIVLNYYQEDHAFMEPRMNQRGDGSGITGMELPLYQYTAMLLYFVTGPSHAVCRLLTMIGALIAATALFAVVRQLTDDLTAAASAWALLFSPLFLFYSGKIMPDIWMLCFLMIAVYTYVRF
jgi:4-amino-4-deoxy-L-arabinose transferase-like glycosyltransferase